MKRIKAACITQTLHFMLKDDFEYNYAMKCVKEEVEKYKRDLEWKGIKYNILREEEQNDGSIIIEIKKQYNSAPVGNYIV